MTSVNKVLLIGSAGSDPDVRYTEGGRKEARLSLATTHQSRVDAGRKDWHRVILFDRLAQIVEDYVSKSDKVFVEGYIRYDSYERDGITIPTVEIVARELVLLENGVDR